jgi:hypothetical protein
MKNSKNFNEIVNFKYQSYRFDSESKLLYLTKRTDSDRLCISAKLSKDILIHAHDANVHDEIHRIYDFLRRSIFITDMKKKVTEYVTTCSFCQISKSSNQKSFEKFQFISIFQKSFFEMSLNFVVKLLMIIKKNNAFLTITNRFFKYVKLISKIESFSTAIWIERYWKSVYRFWKIFHRIVFDRHSKFTSEFWRKLFNKCDVKLNFITTYHSFANDQTKRFNQIMKIALRCLLIKQYEKFWDNLLANIELFLNTSTNVFSEISSFEMLYDVKFRISLLKLITAKTNVDVKTFETEKSNSTRYDEFAEINSNAYDDDLRRQTQIFSFWKKDVFKNDKIKKIWLSRSQSIVVIFEKVEIIQNRSKDEFANLRTRIIRFHEKSFDNFCYSFEAS